MGEIGVIATVTDAFCDSCDRIRLTADGKFRNCLFALKDYDMRDLLRNGASDDEIANLFINGVKEKWAGHQIGKSVFYPPTNQCVADRRLTVGGEFTHLGSDGQARMVDVSGKDGTARRAVARAKVMMDNATLTKLTSGETSKGDVSCGGPDRRYSSCKEDI